MSTAICELHSESAEAAKQRSNFIKTQQKGLASAGAKRCEGLYRSNAAEQFH